MPEHQPFLFDELTTSQAVKSIFPQRLYVHFESLADMRSFERVIEQHVPPSTMAICHPAGDLSTVIALHTKFERFEGESLSDDDEHLTEPWHDHRSYEHPNLFDDSEWWREHWRGMPEFVQRNEHPLRTIELYVRDREARNDLARRLGQKITDATKSLWHPEAGVKSKMNQRYVQDPNVEVRSPRYPIYIVSKGRWESRKTSRELERMRVPYHIVIEPQEFNEYAARIDPAKILKLPFSNLGQGSIPARNWIWEHALAQGVERHWILDDNISGFYRMHRNLKLSTSSGVMFRAAEDFVDRYENVALAGFQYWMFAPHRTEKPPFYLNTRIYSCILIRNDLRYRWRGRYNEDTDLSLRALKDGWVTMLFYAFIADKTTTMTMKGGNTDELYAGTNQGPKEQDGRWKMAEHLREQHPDVTKIVHKWGRWQHSVDYSRFRNNKLIVRPDAVIPDGIDNYGMVYERDDAQPR
jgi:hypothetical protein